MGEYNDHYLLYVCVGGGWIPDQFYGFGDTRFRDIMWQKGPHVIKEYLWNSVLLEIVMNQSNSCKMLATVYFFLNTCDSSTFTYISYYILPFKDLFKVSLTVIIDGEASSDEVAEKK